MKPRRKRSGKPELDDGCVRVAQELAEALARVVLTKEEHSVLWVVLAKNYGWDKKEDWISVRLIAQITGISPAHCSRAISSLVAKNMITRRMAGKKLMLGIQKYYRKWPTLRPVLPDADTRWKSTTASLPDSASLPGLAPLPESAGLPLPGLVGEHLPESAGYIRRTITEEEDTEEAEEGARVCAATEPDAVAVVDVPPTPPPLPRAVVDAFENWKPAAINSAIYAELARLVADHGDAHVLLALKYAMLHTDTVRNPISFLEGKLILEKGRGYTWQTASQRGEKPRYATSTPAKPVDPIDARFRKSQLYRQLEADVECGPFFVLERIKQLAPHYQIDLAPYVVLDASPPPPKPEQRRLIRAFVAAVDPSVTSPSYVEA